MQKRTTLNDVAVGLRALDSSLLNPDFWRDPAKITAYVQGVLEYAGKPARVSVSVDSDRAFCSWQSDGMYRISIPKIPQLIADEKLRKLVYARAMFLRHELGHALFPTTGLDHIETHKFVNQIDDTRVETLYGNVFKGARTGFAELRTVFFNNAKKKIENADPNIVDFGMFIRFESAGLMFSDTPTILFYRRLLGETNVIIEDPKEFVAMCESLHEKAVDEIRAEAEKREAEKREAEKQVNKAGEGEESEGDEAEGDEAEGEATDEGEALDESDADADEGDESHEAEVQSEDSDDSTICDSNGLDGSDIEEDDGEKTDADDLFGESEDVLTYDDMLKDSSAAGAFVTMSELAARGFNPSEYSRAVAINLPEASRMLKGFPQLRSKTGVESYNKIVAHYSSTITQCAKFMSLKLQNRTRTRRIDRQLEGELDARNIVEVVTNPASPRAFYRTVKAQAVDSTVHVLIDASGSMHGEQLKLALTNGVILAEVCRRIKANFALYLFTNVHSTSFLVKDQYRGAMTQRELKKIFGKDAYRFSASGNSVDCVNSSRWGRRAALYVVKQAADRFDREHMSALGTMVEQHQKVARLGRGTPEFQSVLRLFQEEVPGRNILFVVNDGAFDNAIMDNDVTIVGVDEDIAVTSIAAGSLDAAADACGRHAKAVRVAMLDKSAIKYLAIKNGLTFEEGFGIAERVADRLEAIGSREDGPDAINSYGSVEEFEYGAVIKMYNDSPESLLANRKARDFMKDVERAVNAGNDYAVVVYRGLIDAMRRRGWGVYGIGINSWSGSRVIGLGEFTVVDSADEMREVLARRLREIF